MISNNDESAEHRDNAAALKAQSVHDIKASVAILSGYGEALESTFGELCAHVDIVMAKANVVDDHAAMGQMKTLEADCKFCLSRIRLASGQLKERLDRLNTLA